MELQGLQEALKVGIQCHQVNETWCYFSLVGVGASEGRGLSGWRGSSGRPQPTAAAPPEARPATQPPLPLTDFLSVLLADGGSGGLVGAREREGGGGKAEILRWWWWWCCREATRTRPEYL